MINHKVERLGEYDSNQYNILARWYYYGKYMQKFKWRSRVFVISSNFEASSQAMLSHDGQKIKFWENEKKCDKMLDDIGLNTHNMHPMTGKKYFQNSA